MTEDDSAYLCSPVVPCDRIHKELQHNGETGKGCDERHSVLSKVNGLHHNPGFRTKVGSKPQEGHKNAELDPEMHRFRLK